MKNFTGTITTVGRPATKAHHVQITLDQDAESGLATGQRVIVKAARTDEEVGRVLREWLTDYPLESLDDVVNGLEEYHGEPALADILRWAAGLRDQP